MFTSAEVHVYVWGSGRLTTAVPDQASPHRRHTGDTGLAVPFQNPGPSHVTYGQVVRPNCSVVVFVGHLVATPDTQKFPGAQGRASYRRGSGAEK